MRTVRKIEKEEVKTWLKIAETSYPSMELSKEKNMQDLENYISEAFELTDRGFYALYDDDQMAGSMILYDYTGHYYGQEIHYKGVGMVAVDFLKKKQKIAKDMIDWYLEDAKTNGFDMAILHSFRPDFYKNMGFGFGTKVHHYSISPAQLKRFEVVGECFRVNQSHENELTEFFTALYWKQHGMIRKGQNEIKRMLNAPGIYITGFKQNGKMTGLTVYQYHFDQMNHQKTDLTSTLMALNSEGLKGLLNFYRSQSDQIRKIKIQSQNEQLYYLLDDPRHTDLEIIQMPAYHLISHMGLGMLYKSLNHQKLLSLHPVKKATVSIMLEIKDSFPANQQSQFVAEWKDGQLTFKDNADYDVRICLNVAEFSSWMMNAVDLNTLFELGLAEVSPAERCQELNEMFYWHQKPVCDTRF